MLRSDPEKVRAWQRRSRTNLRRTGRLRQRSPRKAKRWRAIADASVVALERDGYRCQAASRGSRSWCAGPLEPHHVIPRSTAPELVADPANIIAVCAKCHAWIGDYPAEAREVGLHGHAGDDLAALALLRSQTAWEAP